MAVAVAVGVGDTGTVGLAVADEVAIEDGVKDAVGVGVTVAEHNAKSVVGSVTAPQPHSPTAPQASSLIASEPNIWMCPASQQPHSPTMAQSHSPTAS